MATQAGALIAAIGAKLGTSFATYTVRYGMPDDSGTYVGTGKRINVRYTEESSRVAGNQLGGLDVVQPRIMISIIRPFESNSTLLATHQATLDLASDLRVAVSELVMSHATGTAISGFSGPLWITDSRTVPSVLDIGTSSDESVTVEFGFKFQRSYGGR